MSMRSLFRVIHTGCALFLAAGIATGQNNTSCQVPDASVDNANSIAAAARAKSKSATHAKKVFTDEDMEVSAGPLPRLRMEGAENGDEIVAAISAYKRDHTAEETERAVRLWYDRYDEILGGIIQEDLDMRTLREANQSNGYYLCQESQDYQKCASRQMADARGARIDQLQLARNSRLEVRIQHAFSKVRNGLQQNNLRYAWFKIRTTNGIDVF